MSRIGRVEKLNIVSVLQRIETFAKTGLLIVKQDTQWVEFYCGDGRLLCVGPIRTDATLGERLLQDGVISSQILQETLLAIGSEVPSETRIALTLMDLGYVQREELRIWTAKKTAEILLVLLSWSTGDIYFEENSAPPAERLLVALSISTLIASLPTASPMSQPVQSPVAQSIVHERSTTVAEVASASLVDREASQSSTLFGSEQFFMASSSVSLLTPPTSPTPYISASMLFSASGNAVTTGPVMLQTLVPSPTPPPMPDIPMTTLPPARRIDTSFMLPDMVLVAGDLSLLQEQHVQVTPEQWQLLTRVDDHTSLKDVCTALNMSPDHVCRIAGELIGEHVLHVVPPFAGEMQEMSPVSRELINSGLGNGFVAPGYAAAFQTPWGGVFPTSDVAPQFSSTSETQSQWGNGGNGATFVPGQGWIAAKQPSLPLQPNRFSTSGVYASASGSR